MKNILFIVFTLFAGLQLMAQEPTEFEDKIYRFVQIKAEPEGGMDNFRKNFANQFNTPDGIPSDIERLIIKIKFVIEKDGSFTNITVKDNKYGAGDEAIRVLKTMPKWKPAQHGGKVVRSAFSLPISILVDNIKEEKNEIKVTSQKVETEYFEFECFQCSVRETGLTTADYRIENEDKTAEFQVTIMQVPEDMGNDLVEMLNENPQDPDATFKDITFLDMPMQEIGFYSYGLRNPYIQIISFYKNGHFISISASSSTPKLAVKYMNDLKQTFKLKI